MNRRKIFTIMFVMVITIFCGSVVGQAQSKKTDIAEMSNNGGNVSWYIRVPYASATLTVAAPDGEVYREEFPAGSIVTFSPLTKRGDYYANGQFKYQIVLTPILSPGVKEALAQSRLDGKSDEVRLDFKKRGMLPAEMIESGAFTVINGTIITGKYDVETQNAKQPPTENPVENVKKPDTNTKNPDTSTSPVPNAGDVPPEGVTVINMDLVVQGSTCIGIDCPANPAFGFDTLRLQENNLRIGFDDTSNTGSFPFNDWEITINDSTNGGLSRFSVLDVTGGEIPFTIEAGAASNALYVDNSGRIGNKTATPVVEIHTRDGNTPTLRLEQDGSQGFSAQTWDVAGNEAVFFIRDVTNGSRLPFKIQPSAPTDTMFLASNGSVSIGVGTSTPTRKLDVNGGIRLRNDVLEFPDGSTQATAAIGSGTNFLTESFAQTVFGGQGRIAGFSSITPSSNFNFFSINTNGQAGFVTSQITVPSNVNLSNQTATNVVYRIRYKDPDGVAAASNVRVDVVAVANDGGGRATKLIFDSNTNASMVNNTVTICDVNDAVYFNYGTRATNLNITLTGTAALTSELFQVQIYKTNTCP